MIPHRSLILSFPRRKLLQMDLAKKSYNISTIFLVVLNDLLAKRLSRSVFRAENFGGKKLSFQNEWHWAATMLERVLFVIFVILGAATALLFAGRWKETTLKMPFYPACAQPQNQNIKKLNKVELTINRTPAMIEPRPRLQQQQHVVTHGLSFI